MGLPAVRGAARRDARPVPGRDRGAGGRVGSDAGARGAGGVPGDAARGLCVLGRREGGRRRDARGAGRRAGRRWRFDRGSWRRRSAAAIACAALLGTLSVGAAVWLVPLLAPLVVAAFRAFGGRGGPRRCRDLDRPRRPAGRPRPRDRRLPLPAHLLLSQRPRARQPPEAAQPAPGPRHLAERRLSPRPRRALALVLAHRARRGARGRAAPSSWRAPVPGPRCSTCSAPLPARPPSSSSARRGRRRRLSRSPRPPFCSVRSSPRFDSPDARGCAPWAPPRSSRSPPGSCGRTRSPTARSTSPRATSSPSSRRSGR